MLDLNTHTELEGWFSYVQKSCMTERVGEVEGFYKQRVRGIADAVIICTITFTTALLASISLSDSLIFSHFQKSNPSKFKLCFPPFDSIISTHILKS